jgi:uncharacterized protein (TIGR03435 family)
MPRPLTKPTAFSIAIVAAAVALTTPQALAQITPSPAYEVATIKPAGPNTFALPLRLFIQNAFGLPVNAQGLVLGPAWIETTTYVIHGQPPDAIRHAMQSMSPADRSKEQQLMDQSLLADRFKLQAHFETRPMPVYELIVAKNGPKLTPNPDTTKAMAAVGSSRIHGTAVSIHALLGLIESLPDIGGRPVLDNTHLTGTYDLNLKWSPLQTTPDPDGPSLFTALEEQLGLKLVPTKAPTQILIIDHIERPSPN